MNNKQQYQSICSRYQSIPVFLQHWWMDAVSDSWDVAITMNGDAVSGIWPYNIESKFGVSLLRTPILTPYQGPYVIYPADLKRANKDSFENEAVDKMLQQLPDSKVWNIACMPGFKQAGLIKRHGIEITTRQTFLIDLNNTEQILLSNMKESLRRNIKSAETEFTIENDTDSIVALFEYHKHTLNNKDVAQKSSLLDMQLLLKACVENDSAAVWVAKEYNKVHAIVWNVWDAERSYYFMGAQNPGSDNYKAMPALLWHCIKEAIKRGNKIFDLEGSMDPGVEKFFRSFGANRELYLVLKKNNSLLWRLKEKLSG